MTMLTDRASQGALRDVPVGSGRPKRPQDPHGGRQVARGDYRHEEPTVSSGGGQLADGVSHRRVADPSVHQSCGVGDDPGLCFHSRAFKKEFQRS